MLGVGLALTSIAGLESSVSPGALLLAGESQGLGLSFVDDFFLTSTSHYGSARVKDTGTPANNYNSHPFGLLSYPGASVKLCRGPSGTLRYGAHNLKIRSEEFTSVEWLKQEVAVPGSTVQSPDGITLFKVVESENNTIHRLRGNTGVTIPDGPVRLEAFAKAAERTRFWIREDNTVGDYAVFDLSAGTATGAIGISAPLDCGIQHIGNGVYRCWIEVTGLQSADIDFRVDNGTGDTYAGDGESGIYIGGAIIRRANSDPTYLKTTDAPRYELPYEWDENGDLLGIRVEEQRTCLNLYGSDFTQSSWTKSNLTAAKTATGPDGVANSASTLTATAANATALQAITSASATRITSCYIKRRTGSGNIDLTQDNGSTWTTVTVTSSWTRVEIAAQTLTDPTVGIRIVTTGDEVDVALFQHEVGAFVTSPIETADSTVTRAADNISLELSRFPYNAVEGVVIVEAIHQVLGTGGSARQVAWELGKDNSNHMRVGKTVTGGADNRFVAFSFVDGNFSGFMDHGNVVVAGQPYKSAMAYKANDFASSLNGDLHTDGAGQIPEVVTSLKLGSGSAIERFINGHIKSLIYLPRRASNAELQTLTGA